jgi:hypothetical protein
LWPFNHHHHDDPRGGAGSPSVDGDSPGILCRPTSGKLYLDPIAHIRTTAAGRPVGRLNEHTHIVLKEDTYTLLLGSFRGAGISCAIHAIASRADTKSTK